MSASDREPLPSDGPEYHADHAAWERRQVQPVRRLALDIGRIRKRYVGRSRPVLAAVAERDVLLLIEALELSYLELAVMAAAVRAGEETR